ncbi:MAG: glycoside hydrolase family 57 protein [Planctomycetota bacterium]|jgi:1,4-alpha-glucan branching enzyme
MNNPSGYLSIVLHAHLPFVRHPEYDNFLEEHWLFEAITETYIPLLRVFDRLENENVDYNILLSLSPTLISMLEDQLLQEKYLSRTYRLLALCEKEVTRNKKDADLYRISKWYYNFFIETLDWFENQCNRSIISRFAEISSKNNLDIMTCCATHGFLPLLKNDPGAVRSQIFTAADFHKQIFGSQSSGIWIPECAYFPGLEAVIKEAGFKFFIIDTHGIENAAESVSGGVYKPIYCPNGVAVMARDQESSKQVWSSEEGYPGAAQYREFYRDAGYDLDEDYLGDILIDKNIRSDTGIKYYKITGSDDKMIYNPDEARQKAAVDAGDFLFKRQSQVELLNQRLDRTPLIVAPYDAELFGHWWFEGPAFLDILLRKIHYDQDVIKTITPEKYLQLFPENESSVPDPSSWGGEGYFEFWCTDCNKWIYPLLNTAANTFQECLLKYPQNSLSDVDSRILKQSARELLLAQSSDWPFIMRTGTSPDYAAKRVNDHLARFQTLSGMLGNNNVNYDTLSAIEAVDNIFPDINPYHFLR